MGDIDLVKVVLDRIGDMRWMQIAIRPAKPFAFGLVDGTPVFGLPGNPVSSMVSFELLARPALRRMAGHAEPAAARRCRRWPPRPSAGGPTARSTSSASPPSATATACCRCARPAARGRTTSPPWPGPTPCCPLADGDGVEAGDPVRVLLLADI